MNVAAYAAPASILSAPIGSEFIVTDGSNRTKRVRIDADIYGADRMHGLIRASVWYTPPAYTHGDTAGWRSVWWDLGFAARGDDLDLGTVDGAVVWFASPHTEYAS